MDYNEKYFKEYLDMPTDFFEIVCNTTNTLHPVYQEAANDTVNGTDKGMAYLKNFMNSIDKISKNNKDKRITDSRGNIKHINCYDSLEYILGFLKKRMPINDTIKNIQIVHDKLIEFQPLYTEAYDKNINIIQLEYESFAYALISVTSLVVSECIEFDFDNDKCRISSFKKLHAGPFQKVIKEAAKHLKDGTHKNYLERLIEASDEVPVSKTESAVFNEDGNVVTATINLATTIFNHVGKLAKLGKQAVTSIFRTVFGIVPLIRSICYLHYKKKADTIASLEEQAAFLQQNIDRLNKITTMDPNKKANIIKKQQAQVRAYIKKAEKLRAEFVETEKDAVKEQKAEDPKMKDTSNPDDDFVLESAESLAGLFKDSE